MTGLQDPNRMASTRLGVDQVACRVNNISKANLRDDWQFKKAPYSCVNPTPMVSPWSPFFAGAYLLIHPNAAREVLLNTIRHPYDRAWAKVVRVVSEEPEAHGREEEAAADAGADLVSLVLSF